MQYYKNHFSPLQPESPQEIEYRLRRRYLDRLSQRVKKIRKLFIAREWELLRQQCKQLAQSGEHFGFQELTDCADQAHLMIPEGKISKAATPLAAKRSIESLIVKIDSILLENHVLRV